MFFAHAARGGIASEIGASTRVGRLVAMVRFFGAADAVRWAHAAIDRSPTTVADGAALRAELIARLRPATTMVRHAGRSADCRRDARAAVQHAAASVGCVAAIEAERRA